MHGSPKEENRCVQCRRWKLWQLKSKTFIIRQKTKEARGKNLSSRSLARKLRSCHWQYLVTEVHLLRSTWNFLWNFVEYRNKFPFPSFLLRWFRRRTLESCSRSRKWCRNQRIVFVVPLSGKVSSGQISGNCSSRYWCTSAHMRLCTVAP